MRGRHRADHLHSYSSFSHEWSSQSRLWISRCGRRSRTGEVNSWPTSESLLHSRRCELPFEISIFYAYTWETCRRPARRYRRATQFRLVQRRRRPTSTYVHTYIHVCMYAHVKHTVATTFAEDPEKRANFFLFLSTRLSATTSLTPVEALSRADIIVPRSGESRSMPSASGLRSYLATRLLRSGVPSI